MKKKRKIKKQVYYISGFLIAFIILIIGLINYIKYISSNPYKLKKIGYKEDEIEIILKEKEKNIEDVIKRNYNRSIVNFMKQKYFLYKNLDRYLEYYKKNKNDKLSHIVSIVNVNADKNWYDKDFIKKTNLEDNYLLLTNKFNYLTEDYEPADLVEVSYYYAYGTNSIRDEVYKAFKNMQAAAKEEGLSLIITSSYRDYKTQDYLWNSYANSKNKDWADSVSARPGFSEHQTGLALDIVTYNSVMNDFEETDEFKWLQKNAHKYGFILRYPKDKTDITGYDYESWHYRYVGIETAKKVKKLDITYDEYYAYYIEKD